MIKVGVVGMGIRGQLYAQTVQQNNYAKLQAVSDAYEPSLAAACERFGAKGYSHIEHMLEQEQLDVLIVATPDYLHKAPVLAAASKGVHILVEKPFSTSLEEAEIMYSAVQKSGIKCMVAFENRWNSPFVAVQEAIRQGEIGRVLTMNSRLNDTIYVPTKMLKWSQGSSPGWFLLPHSIDLALWFKGVKPVKVFAAGSKGKLAGMGIDTYDSIQAIISFEDGTHSSFTTSWVLPESMPMIYDFKYEIIGSDGALYVDLADQMVRQASSSYRHMHTLGTSINGQLGAAPNYMLNAFIDNVRLDTEPLASSADGLLNTRVVAAIHQSIKSGISIHIQ
ncbi:Gfo/Idh/MocA family protein [Paenibacillus sp. GXUN7292]|uniref:Gfo/Idh/MocA family protein n=1 Tax=Paenibacillus sp. GXUN7292 TaxID=3422499 RepID=UPI003D7F0FA3